MFKCSRCGIAINDPDTKAALERELNFRENFPNTWDAGDGRELVCNKCFDEMSAEDNPQEWEILHDE